MLPEYGHFDGEKYAFYRNARDLRGAVIIYVKCFLRKFENPLPEKDGKPDFHAALQNYVKGYGETVFENAVSDGTTPTIVSNEEVADHMLNTFGWVMRNKKSIPPTEVRTEIYALMERWNIQEYERK
jgi:hypothetical protein